ncbi:auxin-responsive protein SAUR71-like [Panicum miliaceum]|uniref:Auxin-responsive protein SAUR71-like n=1 Tax=Panicum miliaceum TaxID=4540 RepID=A0A3L6RST3_PANMI|nr:auxin-responsive protein SAUR71-like [Panicum miliaceum]
MKRLLRRLSRTVAAAEDGAAPAAAPRQVRARKGKGVPEGHVPVCVGEEGGPVERFAVRAELLGEPAFAALLRRAAQEYGYAHPGALRIPCPAAEFRRLLRCLSDGDPAAASC